MNVGLEEGALVDNQNAGVDDEDGLVDEVVVGLGGVVGRVATVGYLDSLSCRGGKSSGSGTW